jgi:hypothetical protein
MAASASRGRLAAGGVAAGAGKERLAFSAALPQEKSL